MLLSSDQRSAAATYLLPGRAAQGPNAWYVLHLHFRLRLAGDTPPGRIYLVADTNDRTAAQIRFNVQRAGDGVFTHWDTLGLLGGRRDFFTASRVIEGFFYNYLQTQGVRSGSNTLRMSVQDYDGAKFDRVSILDDSGIELTLASPPQLSLEPIVPRRPVRVGDIFDIGFRVTNRGGHPANGVVEQAKCPTDAIRVIGKEHRSFGDVHSGAAGRFTFEFGGGNDITNGVLLLVVDHDLYSHWWSGFSYAPW
jgi:hypothetical protein